LCGAHHFPINVKPRIAGNRNGPRNTDSSLDEPRPPPGRRSRVGSAPGQTEGPPDGPTMQHSASPTPSRPRRSAPSPNGPSGLRGPTPQTQSRVPPAGPPQAPLPCSATTASAARPGQAATEAYYLAMGVPNLPPRHSVNAGSPRARAPRVQGPPPLASHPQRPESQPNIGSDDAFAGATVASGSAERDAGITPPTCSPAARLDAPASASSTRPQLPNAPVMLASCAGPERNDGTALPASALAARLDAPATLMVAEVDAATGASFVASVEHSSDGPARSPSSPSSDVDSLSSASADPSVAHSATVSVPSQNRLVGHMIAERRQRRRQRQLAAPGQKRRRFNRTLRPTNGTRSCSRTNQSPDPGSEQPRGVG